MILRRFRKSNPDYVEWNGLRLPPTNRRYCTEEWKDDDYYVQSARADVSRLEQLCGLGEGSTLLDLGSGQGRLAIGLMVTMPEVNYFGIDVDQQSIDWCKRNISAIAPNFRFIHTDILNDRYNPHGARFEPPIALPLSSDSIDVAFAYSVFTHMRTVDVSLYLEELRRVLKAGGAFLFTIYVENGCEDEFRKSS